MRLSKTFIYFRETCEWEWVRGTVFEVSAFTTFSDGNFHSLTFRSSEGRTFKMDADKISVHDEDFLVFSQDLPPEGEFPKCREVMSEVWGLPSDTLPF